ncbi:MAG: glycosyltransferase family 4 protein [Gammaproteobacteria bacterium]|nr:glycosyltransferase family 4 protein [Gammaproteobacteria bacterium]
MQRRRAKRASLVLGALFCTVCILTLLPRQPKFYPTIAIDAAKSVRLTVFQEPTRTRAECLGRIREVAGAVVAACEACNVVAEQCTPELSPNERRILKGHATDVSTARIAGGVIVYTAESPGLARQTCLEVERVYGAAGPTILDCVPAGPANLSRAREHLEPAQPATMPTPGFLIALTLAVAGVAFLACYVLVAFEGVHARLSADLPGSGPQKFHSRPTPRVGGIALALGLIAGVVALRFVPGLTPRSLDGLTVLALCAIPAFGGGLAEDLTKRVGPAARLLLTLCAGVVAALAVGATLDRLDVPGLDSLLLLPVVPVLFTAFAVAGVANAINIVDGYNGLASGYAIIVLAAFATLALLLHDRVVLCASLIMLGALAGFLVWNWPLGRLFLGDGGAYLLGFWVAELAVLTVLRNPEVSPWFPLVLLIHPIFETLFSIYRRALIRGRSPGQPDGFHFHTLIFKRLVRIHVGRKDHRSRLARNNGVAPYIWVMTAMVSGAALSFWSSTDALVTIALASCMLYVWIYNRLLRWRAPKWLVFQGRKPAAAPMPHAAVAAEDAVAVSGPRK